MKKIPGLVVDFARSNKIDILIRSIRCIIDLEYEKKIAFLNKKISSNLETIFLLSSYDSSFISSSLVKEIAYYGGNISRFLPKPVRKDLNRTILRKINL
ncbi:phosphopantetheine adenylyltransferase [Candidatus Riesia pediculicola USDA]|uniref:Phosphopantetheine adenylyltransferase n=1 Tax=Riesia pediculicola (strain USDA) TaxID=515618 RepID=D4G8U4_RIEPU|nr:phosphopantetheine adenylyltransferase [Candidatus Riesia pediculicola USDA]